MTQETPAKVFSLLGASVFSMFFLFAVSVTNASFSGTETAFPDVFGPDNVLAVLDTASNSYSKAVTAYLIEPAQESTNLAMDNINYVIDEAGPSIMAMTGKQSSQESGASALPQVAGQSTRIVYSRYYPESKGVLGIFSP